MMMKKKKHLSDIANEVLHRCALKLDVSTDELVEEFEGIWKLETDDYSRKLVEFCSAKAIKEMCPSIGENISDGSFSRFTFDMMLAWEKPSSNDEEPYTESVGKEKEDRKRPPQVAPEVDEISLFYSDIMPLLVTDEPCVRENAFVWLSSLVPLIADIVNARFTFETLTATTANQLHFPAYDKFLKEIDKCIKHLQKQATPTGVELGDDEFILHVEGTAGSQRVVRHIGASSWPGRLTLTNYALYFEASGVISYEDALKIDLSKDIEHDVKTSSTGPWGAPLFDKAIVYESPESPEGVVLEFPEITSSTRRDHWLALIREVMLMHQFLSKFKVDSHTHAWETHARTILCITRLHAAREMLRISPPNPTKFLIFSLFEDLPKGDCVIEELAESLKNINSGHACSASSILRNLNTRQSTVIACIEVKEGGEEIMCVSGQVESPSALESVIDQVREEAKEVQVAKASVEGLKEEGISESAIVLMGLLSPLKSSVTWVQDVMNWNKPGQTLFVIAAILIISYKEWIGKAIAALLLWLVAKMVKARREGVKDGCNEIVICTGCEQTAIESIVSAQHGLNTFYDMIQKANISILKIRSILVSKATKHADVVMMVLTGMAIILAVVPFKYIIIGTALHYFTLSSFLGKYVPENNSDRRLKEWWESIPVIPVRIVDKISECPK